MAARGSYGGVQSTEAMFERSMAQFMKHYKLDRWQEGLLLLKKALSICNRATFVARKQCEQRVFYEMGRVHARMGQYGAAIKDFKKALEIDPRTSPGMLAKIWGELGITYRHQNESEDAQESFGNQYRVAYEMSVEAEAEMCNSIGNEGMAAFSRYHMTKTRAARPLSADERTTQTLLLHDASLQLQERLRLADRLKTRLEADEESESMLQRYKQDLRRFKTFIKQYKEKCETWQIEGEDRLSLCHIAEAELFDQNGDPAAGRDCRRKALDAVKRSKMIQDTRQGQPGEEDITVRAMSQYFYGYALFVNGDRDKALEVWSTEAGVRGPAHAFCKQPAKDHVEYIRIMARAGARFDEPDEQDFTPLDYAYVSDNEDANEMINIIVEDYFKPRLREFFRNKKSSYNARERSRADVEKDVNAEIEKICAKSELRRYYREVLQEQIRPELGTRSRYQLQKIRRIYADALGKDPKKQQHLDWFYYMPYQAFKSAGELPHSNLHLAQKFDVTAQDPRDKELFIIFFSYRWIGYQSHRDHPDDQKNSQYNRMVEAVNYYLDTRDDLEPENVGIWLDYACISQTEWDRKGKGVNALPLAVTQCDVLISLVDDQYFERAWCAVEVKLMRELLDYGIHEWRCHILDDPDRNLVNGYLADGVDDRSPMDEPRLLLSNEDDRPKVDFLNRQAKLLGSSRKEMQRRPTF